MKNPDLNFRSLWKPFAVAVVLAFLYATTLSKLGRDWWTDENYSHGLLVPFVIGFIVWLEFDALRKAPKNASALFGGAMIGVALVFLLVGTLGAELFAQRISLVLMLVGAIVYFWGARVLRLLAAPFLLLLFAVPIPQIIFNKIAFPLQIWASQISVWGIRLFEVPSVRKGNVIEILPKGATQVVGLEVVEACSGIRSLMTLVTLALVLAYFTGERRARIENGFWAFLKSFEFWRAAVLMLSAIPIAILTNAARVTATGILTYHYGKQAAEGAWHDASGWLVYLAALVLLVGVNFALQKIFRKDTAVLRENLDGGNSAASASNPKSVWLFIAVLLVGGVFINWFERRGEATVERRPLSEISARLGDWTQKGADIRFSEATESILRTTDYVMRDYLSPKGKRANLYVGYYASQRAGATYHSPQNCLPGAGWEMRNPELVEVRTPNGNTFTANRYVVVNGEYREVLIYWYQGRGRREASEYADKVYTVFDGILRRRSDGAMVRVMTSVGANEAESLQSALDLSAQIADELAPFVPE